MKITFKYSRAYQSVVFFSDQIYKFFMWKTKQECSIMNSNFRIVFFKEIAFCNFTSVSEVHSIVDKYSH